MPTLLIENYCRNCNVEGGLVFCWSTNSTENVQAGLRCIGCDARYTVCVSFDEPHTCETCEHKRYPQGGHCYMFKEQREMPCAQWTAIR